MISLSYSGAERYISSPRSFFLHYYLRLRPKELSSPLFFGSAVDNALNILLAPPLNRSPETLAAAKAEFDRSWATAEINGQLVVLSAPGAIKFSKADLDESLIKEVDPTKDLSWQSLQAKGHMILDAYSEQIVPRIKEVLTVQKNIDLKNEQGDSFVGVIDLIVKWEDDRIILFDNKTSSIKYAWDAVETSEQLSTYWDAVRDEYGLDAAGYIVIPKKVRKKKEPLIPIEVMIGSISEELVIKTYEKYESVLSGIKNGVFDCTPSGCCSKPWPCSYKRFCSSDGMDMTGLAVHKERVKK